MKKLLKMLFVGVLLLGSSALWTFGGHIAWSVEGIVMAAFMLAVMGFAIYL